MAGDAKSSIFRGVHLPIPSNSDHAITTVNQSLISTLVEHVRPEWRQRRLIERVRVLMPVDPSSACQRLFNASIHDLREKVALAGLDIARTVAQANKLPPVTDDESIQNYPTSALLALTYRMGILSRADWKRMDRCYEIRRDLEHEDNQYEAMAADCMYMFDTCVRVVLAVDPVPVLRVDDVKALISADHPTSPTQSLIDEHKLAPEVRQTEILKFLASKSLNEQEPEIVQQNAIECIRQFAPFTKSAVQVTIARDFQAHARSAPISDRTARVAFALGALGYFNESQLVDYFSSLLTRMKKVGSSWRAHQEHRDLLQIFADVGGFAHCPATSRYGFVLFMSLTYIGTPGGTTSWGHVRHVFFSDAAEPMISRLFKDAGQSIHAEFVRARKDRDVKDLCTNTHIARRLEALEDLLDASRK